LLQLGCVFLIIASAGYVIASSYKAVSSEIPYGAIKWAIFSGFCFATSFTLGQGASGLGDEISLLVPNRVFALLTVIVLAISLRKPVIPDMSEWWVFMLMAALDAVAQSLVISSGSFESPVFASIGASLFGLFTILLATIFLKEPVNMRQWIAICIVFLGLSTLAYSAAIL
jgi:drug/metabolite transporter (DMT)-like permease